MVEADSTAPHESRGDSRHSLGVRLGRILPDADNPFYCAERARRGWGRGGVRGVCALSVLLSAAVLIAGGWAHLGAESEDRRWLSQALRYASLHLLTTWLLAYFAVTLLTATSFEREKRDELGEMLILTGYDLTKALQGIVLGRTIPLVLPLAASVILGIPGVWLLATAAPYPTRLKSALDMMHLSAMPVLLVTTGMLMGVLALPKRTLAGTVARACIGALVGPVLLVIVYLFSATLVSVPLACLVKNPSSPFYLAVHLVTLWAMVRMLREQTAQALAKLGVVLCAEGA